MQSIILRTLYDSWSLNKQVSNFTNKIFYTYFILDDDSSRW